MLLSQKSYSSKKSTYKSKYLLGFIILFGNVLFSQETFEGVTSTASASGDHAFAGTHPDGVFTNWLNTGDAATAYNLLGFTNKHAGFGVANGPNIVSPIVWMYTNPKNAFRVRTINYDVDLTNGYDLFTVRANGNVGINTSTPSANLEVRNANNLRTVLNRNDESAISFLPNNGNSIFHISHGLNNDLNISHGSNPGDGHIMTIKNIGRVGIGTTAPKAPLAIVAENWQEGPAIPKVLSVADPSDETKTISIGYDKNNDAGVIASVDGGTGWKNTLIQPYGGHVGIGTLDPDEKLDVNGTIQSDYLIVNASNSIEGGEIRLDGPDSFNDWRLDNFSGHFRLHHSGVEYLRLEPDGYLGIGTNNPEEKLSVNGTATIMGDIGITTQSHWKTGSHTLELQNKDAGDVVLSFHRAGHSHASIKHSALGGLVFSGNGAHDSKHLVLKPNGHLGIGTDDTKGFELGVKGKIAAEEVKVAIYPWPDFVFKSDYNLPTLKEVEQHIKQKGHLKDIPSAKEVKEDGIFLGDMNSKLLQKIEELTLYTIEQQKEINKLKTLEKKHIKQEQRINKLEKLIAELSKSVNTNKE